MQIQDKLAQSAMEFARKRILLANKIRSSHLDLSGLGLREIPSEIASLENLQYLNLNYNKIENPFRRNSKAF